MDTGNHWETTEFGMKYTHTPFSTQTWPGRAFDPVKLQQFHRSTAIILSSEENSPQDERPQYTLCPPSHCTPGLLSPLSQICLMLDSPLHFCPRWSPIPLLLPPTLLPTSLHPTPDCSTESSHSHHLHLRLLQPVICAPSAPLYLFDDIEYGHRGFLGSGFAHGQELPWGQNPEEAKGDPDQHSLLEAHRQVGIRTSKVGIILGAARTEHRVTWDGLTLTGHTGQEPTFQ